MTRAPLRDLLVGLFVLAGLGAIAYLSLSVGGVSLRRAGGLTLFADFDETGGLKPRAQAVISGVKVGQVCGFEALPPDMLVALAEAHALEHWHEGLAAVDLEVAFTPPAGLPRPSDGISGGTFQSLAAVAASEDAATITDSALLITDAAVAAAVRRVSPIALTPRRGAAGAIVAPMSPAPSSDARSSTSVAGKFVGPSASETSCPRPKRRC